MKSALLGGCVALLTAGWWFRADLWIHSPTTRDGVMHLQWCAIAVGATLAVLLPLVSRRCSSALCWRGLQWAGTRSFSIYLVHEAVVVSVAFALGASDGWLLLLVLAVPLALGLAELFYRLVDLPSHRLSRRVGAALADRTARRVPAEVGAS